VRDVSHHANAFRSVRFLSDRELLGQCRTDVTRGSGPGGQKRNKTSNAIRLTHLPTGVQVVAGESRSQAENKLFAMRRMRLKLATELREQIDLATFAPPDWFLEVRRDTRIEVSHRHPYYAAVGGLILDLLGALHGNPADAAGNLGVSTTAVIKFLENEPAFWTAANRIRADNSLPALTHRR
jgi:hypothetical protein